MSSGSPARPSAVIDATILFTSGCREPIPPLKWLQADMTWNVIAVTLGMVAFGCSRRHGW
jgi:hypothetical protein